MKDVGYGVGSILSECERIESVFVNNTETTENIVSCSLTLTLPASIYTKTAGTATRITSYNVCYTKLLRLKGV